MRRYNRRDIGESEFESDDSLDVQIRRRVQNRIQARSRFYITLFVMLALNGMLWLIWIASKKEFPWPIFITFPSIIGLAAQALQVYQYTPEEAARREDEIEREVELEKRRRGIPSGIYETHKDD